MNVTFELQYNSKLKTKVCIAWNDRFVHKCEFMWNFNFFQTPEEFFTKFYLLTITPVVGLIENGSVAS